MTAGDWRDGGFRQRRPSMETLAWVAASMGRGSRIVGFRRLTGGVCSAVHRLTVERRGMRTFVVLRQYPGGLGLQPSLENEIANLGVVAGSGLPAPAVLATDVAGASTGGAPSLLMTRLPGHVHLDPAEPRSWLTRIAELAVLLHSLDLPATLLRPWTDSWIAPLDGFQVPVDAQ
ncbi:MAG TPA: phosphotransferase, partial [Micromonosporaceae bacterium]|nr:phosphotransferase [Micromonosporaceae bacterium]